MKKTLSILSLVALLIALGGCFKKADELKTSILDQATTTANSVKETVNSVQDQAVKTKESVEKKINDVNDAIDKVNAAADAVKKVTE